jgi:biopolymer transport protein ExbB
LIEYLIAGGPVMIPIGVASIVGFAAFLERLWALRRGRVLPRGMMVEMLELTRQGRFDEALTICKKRDVALTRIFEVGLRMKGQPRSVIKERLEEVGRREAAELERFVPVMSTVASISTLLGLLGTVGGMIMTFEALVAAGKGDAAALAQGIAQALITTFAGLAVAIPMVVAHRVAMARVDNLLLDLEEASLALLELVSEPTQAERAEKAS